MARRPADCLVSSDEIIRLRELRRSEFFADVLKSGGLGHAALCTLTAGPDITVQFSVHKTLARGAFNSTETLALRRLLPHVRRAMGVSLRLKPIPGPDPNTLADRLVCAAFILNRDGGLVDANPEAQSLAVSCSAFSIYKDGIRFRNPDLQHRVLSAVKRVLDGAPLQPLQLTDGDYRFDLMILGLKRHNRPRLESLCAQSAEVLVLIETTHRTTVSQAHAHMHEHLTEAELRVARVAALGVSSLEISRTLQLSVNTVKTHLRRVYQKLDVHRQGELVALLGSYRHPIG
jgi:DNA-binding CsgD family transcriptional regulator